jgi:hypothetical protein
MKSQQFFRYVWRVNALLILVAAGAVLFGVSVVLGTEFGNKASRAREAETGIAIEDDASSNARLSLGRASIVEGTDVLRVDLSYNREGSGGFSSSGTYAETRNILFIERGQKTGRWLLPDNNHVIEDSSDITSDTDDKPATPKRTIATVALVKPVLRPTESASATLLLFDPTGRKIVEVAANVREIHLAVLSAGELTILYERQQHIFLAAFDPATLAKRSEREIAIPSPTNADH